MIQFSSFYCKHFELKVHNFINTNDGILSSAIDTMCQVMFLLCVAACCIWPCRGSVSFCSVLITGMCVQLIVLVACCPPVLFELWKAVKIIQTVRQIIGLRHSFAALLPALGNGVNAIMCPCNCPCHASNGVSVTTQSQAVGYCPLQSSELLWQPFPGLQTMQHAEDSGGHRL